MNGAAGKPHPRTFAVDAAEAELAKAVGAAVVRHKLTYAELFTVLNRCTAAHLKYALRAERHPHEPGKGADEA